MNRKLITFLTVGIWTLTFMMGLWPFNFLPGNRIQWLPGGAGLRFDRYGQVYSIVPIFPLTGQESAADATIELAFTPSKSYKEASTVFSIINRDEIRFAIGQSLTDLFLQGSFTGSTGKPVAKLWVDHVCGQAQELFVTVTLDMRHVQVYLDGQLARSFPVSTRVDNLRGRALVGHIVKGGAQWSGTVARLAILDGGLDTVEINHRYEQWTRTRHLGTGASHKGAVYEFVTPAGFVKDEGDSGPGLIVPKVFRSLNPTVLGWPDRFNRSVAIDAGINIGGFVPFGLATCLCLLNWTGWSISRRIAVTILLGASASLVIELLQVFLPTRDSSLADLVTNIIGSAIGAVVTATL